MRVDEQIDWARDQAHRHEERWQDHRHTPGDYWRSWSWLDRAMVLAGGATLAIGGWAIVILGIAAGSAKP